MNLGQKLIYAAFVALMISTLVASHPIRVHAAAAASNAAVSESGNTRSLLLHLLTQIVNDSTDLPGLGSVHPAPANAVSTPFTEQKK